VFFETIGDVLEEDEAENDMLILRRIHVVAELVGGKPELGLEAEVGRRVLGGGGFAFGGHGKFRKSGKSWQRGWDNYRVTSKIFGKIIREHPNRIRVTS
jgi:hypothetical protein